VPEGAKEGIINQALLKITLNQDIMNNIYFIQLFRNEQIQDKLFGFSRGSGIPNFPSMNEVKSMEFLCPPIELQNKFADFVKQVDKLKVDIEKSLKELEDNFNSLMQKAFNGYLFN
jgi:type I restriction enzyme S subunit